jgi:hypothetical protein
VTPREKEARERAAVVGETETIAYECKCKQIILGVSMDKQS